MSSAGEYDSGMETETAPQTEPTWQIDTAALASAIIELNSMSPFDAVIMDRAGGIRAGYAADEDALCVLIPAPKLARQLTADGLSSYTGKELKKWAEAYDAAPLQEIVNQALAVKQG